MSLRPHRQSISIFVVLLLIMQTFNSALAACCSEMTQDPTSDFISNAKIATPTKSHQLSELPPCHQPGSMAEVATDTSKESASTNSDHCNNNDLCAEMSCTAPISILPDVAQLTTDKLSVWNYEFHPLSPSTTPSSLLRPPRS